MRESSVASRRPRAPAGRWNTPIGVLAFVLLVGFAAGLAPADAADWLMDNFDSYTVGNLPGQGGWTGPAGPVRVETTYVKSGKSVEANYLAWGAGNANHAVSSGGGYHYIEFDAAMDTAAVAYSQNLGYLMIFNSSGAEITRVYYAHQEFKVLLSPANRCVIQPNVVAKQWYHIKLGINLATSKMDAWVDGVQKLSNGDTYGSGSSIGTITFGQWSSLGENFTKSETYIDNLACYTGPPTPVATMLRSGSGWSGWERKNLFDPCVVYDGAAGNYKMYYSSTGMLEENEAAWDQHAICLATSTDTETWTRKTDDYEPVLYPRKFYQGDLIDPTDNAAIFDSMFAFAPRVIQDGSTWKMWYTGWNGESEHIGGGIENKINFRIGLATSTDLIAWTKQPGSGGGGAVFGLGAAGSQDAKGVGRPVVIKEGSLYRMWYEGFDGSLWRILYATSSDGMTWARQGLALGVGGSGALDELGARCPVVISRLGQYELWYQGKSSSSPDYHILRATSANGLTWTRVPGEVAFHPSNALDGDEQINVGSIIVKPDNSCQVFFSKENAVNVTVTYGTIVDHSYSIYSETVTP